MSRANKLAPFYIKSNIILKNSNSLAKCNADFLNNLYQNLLFIIIKK